MLKIAFGLGSNLGEREANLMSAINYLGEYIANIKASEIFETKALLLENAPADWDINYLNQIVVGEIVKPHNPELLLKSCKEIEAKMGRASGAKWSPRLIDVDIIAIEGVNWQSETLQIPHPLAHTRHFVLAPLAQVWAEALLANGKTAARNLMELQID
jgi:2-amino-4-hydroxy-6-hydroxymethyldihydropteridine diphosphokinase